MRLARALAATEVHPPENYRATLRVTIGPTRRSKALEGAPARGYVTPQVTIGPAMPALPVPRLDVAKPVLLPVGRDYLRNEMCERHATVTSLAKALGVSRKHLSNVLNGHAPLLEPLLGQLCQALTVEPSFLVCLLDYGPEPEPASYGAMEGTIEVLADPTEPMQGWEMLEE